MHSIALLLFHGLVFIYTFEYIYTSDISSLRYLAEAIEMIPSAWGPMHNAFARPKFRAQGS